MNRRSFFGLAFGALLAKFLPKPKLTFSSTAMWNVCGGNLGRPARFDDFNCAQAMKVANEQSIERFRVLLDEQVDADRFRTPIRFD